MNQVSKQFGLGFQIHQAKGKWFVVTGAAGSIVQQFEYIGDTIIIDRADGSVSGKVAGNLRPINN